jgi:hypothetical protein
MKYAELGKATGWKLNTMRRLAAAGIIFPVNGRFAEAEVQRILHPSFLQTWLGYCKTARGIDNNRLRMTAPVHQQMLPNTAAGLSLLERLHWLEHGYVDYPNLCVECQQPVKIFHGFGSGYAEFCSAACVRRGKVVRERVRNTVYQRYGVENVSQLNEVREKVSSTVMAKFGAFFNPIERAKTNLERYGVETPLWLPEVSARRKATRAKNVITKLVYPEGFSPQFSEEEYLAEGRGRYGIFHSACGKTFTHLVPFNQLTCKFCEGGRSSLERLVAQGLVGSEVELGAVLTVGSRRLFPDIKIEDLIVEVDGNYWHAELRGGDKTKTAKRVRLLRENGYKVMVFFEDEVVNKLPIVHSMINAKLGRFAEVHGARECTVVNLDANTAKKFLDQHHIQGHVNSSVRVGIVKNDVLLGVAVAGKKRFGGTGYELLRLAFAKNIAVSGGSERLIRAVKQKTDNLISYSDNRFGVGGVYQRTGTLLSENPPAYFYLDKKDYLTRMSRLRFQKHRLQSKLKSFDKTLSEWENMKNAGYDRIWDCGSKTWSL